MKNPGVPAMTVSIFIPNNMVCPQINSCRTVFMIELLTWRNGFVLFS